MPATSTSLFERPAPSLSVPMVAALSRNTSKQFVEIDTNRDLALLKDRILLQSATLFILLRMLRDDVIRHASDISDHNDIPPHLAEKWVEEARELGKDSRLMRSTADEAMRAVSEIESHGVCDPDVTVPYMRLANQMEELADIMEDVAETQALAAHKPFRDCVKGELEAAAVL